MNLWMPSLNKTSWKLWPSNQVDQRMCGLCTIFELDLVQCTSKSPWYPSILLEPLHYQLLISLIACFLDMNRTKDMLLSDRLWTTLKLFYWYRWWKESDDLCVHRFENWTRETQWDTGVHNEWHAHIASQCFLPPAWIFHAWWGGIFYHHCGIPVESCYSMAVLVGGHQAESIQWLQLLMMLIK